MVFAHSLAPTLQSKLSGRFLRITVQSEEEYQKLATYFRHEQIAFKSFMLKSERPLKLYIQLTNDLNADSIYNYVDMFGTRVAFEPSVRSNSTRAQLRPNAHSLTFNFNVQSLSICFWNANGLRPKICEVRDFVSEQNPDLLLVQETKLQPGLDPLIANYRLHKDDRNNFPRTRTDGGTAIYCKNTYDHNRVPLPTLQYMDAIEIKLNNFPPILIVSAYARNTPENNRKFTDKDFLKILNSGQNIIIAGDLNAAHRTWSNARSNAFGYALRKIVNNKSNVRIVAPHTPTHINASSRPDARDSIIDLAVLKNIPFNHDIRVIDDLESDHLPRHLRRRRALFGGNIPIQKTTSKHPPLKAALGSVANNSLEQAKVIADSLQKQFEPNTEAENDHFTAHTQRKIKRFLDAPTCLDLEKTTPGEVQEYIKKLKINKSPGFHLTTNRILKNLPLKFVLFTVMLFNLLIENCHFPKNWKTAVVVPILKTNSDDTRPQNYRPISLLSSLSKAYEFVLLNRLNQHCIARNIIIPEQHGFVTQCSTVTQLLRVTEMIHHGFQNNQAMGMLFVYIAKAFDKIWHDGLLSKMIRLGFSDQLIKIIHSYLSSHEFRVRVENSLSTPRPILSGVPQGSLLGPKLFNLYINPIPKAAEVHLVMYADDTAIFTQNIYNCNIIERLQNYVIRLETWLNDGKIKVNASKSACLLFTRQRCIGNLPHVNIFNQPVPWVTEYKYLGLILDTKLNFAKHIRSAHQKAAGMRCIL
ncbi:RNA-directed DNA polymerase from mobile element jockey [Trichonephila clavipes]|nr:RNA-directed DNA polymerase from mobile element jockey [Trichonephila clavipes]